VAALVWQPCGGLLCPQIVSHLCVRSLCKQVLREMLSQTQGKLDAAKSERVQAEMVGAPGGGQLQGHAPRG
jgi:hypothetical protein